MPTADERDLYQLLFVARQSGRDVNCQESRAPKQHHACRSVYMQIDGNGGHLVLSEDGDLPDFGTVYHHSDALANILCFADVEDSGRISCCSLRQSSFYCIIYGYHHHSKRVKTGNAH